MELRRRGLVPCLKVASPKSAAAFATVLRQLRCAVSSFNTCRPAQYRGARSSIPLNAFMSLRGVMSEALFVSTRLYCEGALDVGWPCGL